MKLPQPSGRLVPVPPPPEGRPANEDGPPRRAERVALPKLQVETEQESPFLRPDRRTRARRLRRGPVWNGVRLAQWGALAVLVALAAWVGYMKIMSSPHLKVSKIEVRGDHFLSEGEVRELLGPAVGQNILSLDIEDLKARLRSSPWVAEASVVRSLPDTLHVNIRERHPIALAELERLYLMDVSGDLVALHGPRTSAFDLPIVRGLAGLVPDERHRRAVAAGAMLEQLGELAATVSEVFPEADGEMRLVLRHTGDVLVLGSAPARDKLGAFLGLREQLVARVGPAEYWDLRFRDRIYARPAAVPAAVAAPAPAPVPVDVAPVAPSPVAPPLHDGARVLPAEPSTLTPAVVLPVSATAPAGR